MICLGKSLKNLCHLRFRKHSKFKALFFMSGTWYESRSIGATQTRPYIHTTKMTQLPSLMKRFVKNKRSCKFFGKMQFLSLKTDKNLLMDKFVVKTLAFSSTKKEVPTFLPI